MKSKVKTKENRRSMSGGAKLMASGKRPVLIGLTTIQHQKLSAAAAADNRPLTQFLTHYGLVAAQKILEKFSNSA